MQKSNKNIILILFILNILGFFSSCTQHGVEIDSEEKKEFVNSSDIGLYNSGESYFIYDEYSMQMAISQKRHIVRIQTDSQDEYYSYMFENIPKNIGVHILVQCNSLYKGEKKQTITLMECTKLSENYMWFWDADEKKGIILPRLSSRYK